MATTYCDDDDVISIAGEAFINACIDDDEDGVISVAEEAYTTSAIERAAVEMNSALNNQYKLSDLAGNDWCKWCNAYLAVWNLAARKNNPPPASVIAAVDQFKEQLSEARWGRFQIPEQSPSFDHSPSVSNLRPEAYKQTMPARVVEEESTRAVPTEGIQREVAFTPGPF